MKAVRPSVLILTCLGVAWVFDLVFWGRNFGINFILFTAVVILAGLALARVHGVRPAAASLALLLPAGFFAAFTNLRSEPLSVLLALAVTLGLLGMLAMSFTGGRWTAYTLTDHVVGWVRLAFGSLVRGGRVWFGGAAARSDAAVEASGEPARPAASLRRAAPVLRGILLALPVIVLLAAMLSSADPVFARLFDVFRIERLPELFFRGGYILLGAFLLSGLYLFAFQASADERLASESNAGRGWLAPFLGWTEAVIVLGSIVALFAVFVGVQVRYFFGGQANISTSGFTYAEYARRGFFELLGVAVISLLIFLALSAVTRRGAGREQRVFSGLAVALMGLVTVILVSAFQRLTLYEAAYGFTRLRLYTHIFLIALGLFLAAVVLLELAGRRRAFALAGLVFLVGFTAAIDLINVDAQIVRQNVARAAAGKELDVATLANLSEDAVPPLVQAWQSADLPAEVSARAGAALACMQFSIHQGDPDDRPVESWLSYHTSRNTARALLAEHAQALQRYQAVNQNDYDWTVEVNGVQISCFGRWMD